MTSKPSPTHPLLPRLPLKLLQYTLPYMQTPITSSPIQTASTSSVKETLVTNKSYKTCNIFLLSCNLVLVGWFFLANSYISLRHFPRSEITVNPQQNSNIIHQMQPLLLLVYKSPMCQSRLLYNNHLCFHASQCIKH